MDKRREPETGCSIIVPMSLEQEIKREAVELGFDAVGITDASPIEQSHVEHLRTWLEWGFAGEMRHMHRNFEKRIDPARLLKGAKSVIVVALNYKPVKQRVKEPPPAARPPVLPGAATRASTPMGRVAQYAQYEDYHDFMRPFLFELADFVRSRTGGTHRFKACVDSAPLAERALAVRAGLGFIGRNHTLIHRSLGPQVFLGELITTVPLDPDAPGTGSCGDCRRCIEACPTGALRVDGRFDARRCISYLTIEHRGDISDDLARTIGDRIFGCDDCVLACPHQEASPTCANPHIRFHPDRARLGLREILQLTDVSFEETFRGSPVARLGLGGLRRNAQLCLRNVSGGSSR